MSYTAPADLPAQWRAKADELETGIEARTLRECADALAESLYANASAYLDRLGIPALGGPVDTPACPPTTHSIDECGPPPGPPLPLGAHWPANRCPDCVPAAGDDCPCQCHDLNPNK